MDNKAFFKMSYGLYIISSQHEGKQYGCVVNTLSQVTATPVQMSIAINKENATTDAILKSGYFVGVVLAESVTMDMIGTFGFKTSKDVDKFAEYKTQIDEKGIAYVTEGVSARFSCKVINTLDIGTHIMIVGEVENAEIVSADPVMTYSYYHQVKNGVTPPKASAYQAEVKKGYRCKVCGYVYEGEPLPEDFVCPICKKGREFFEPIG